MRHLQLAGHRPLALVGGAILGQIAIRQSGERQFRAQIEAVQLGGSLRAQISRFS